MDIVSEDDVNIVDAKQVMEDRKNDKDLIYEQKICMEYLEKVVKMTPAKAKALVDELNQISILKPRYISLIVTMLPDTEEEVEMLFSKERTNLKKEEVKQIVEIIGKYKK